MGACSALYNTHKPGWCTGDGTQLTRLHWDQCKVLCTFFSLSSTSLSSCYRKGLFLHIACHHCGSFNKLGVVRKSTIPGNSALFTMLYSQRSNIGWLSPGIFYIPKWLPGSYSAMGFPLFSCCWNIDAASLQKSYLMPMFKYKTPMWDVPFCSSSHLSDACRQLAEGMVLGCGGRECVNRWGKKMGSDIKTPG